MKPKRILLTGATGYVGGRLLPLLQSRGYHVRCLTRRPEVLADRISDTTEIAQADVLDRGSLAAAMEGIGTAFYSIEVISR
jgi:uncharacterized protein YbjT (DUF2867 family)